MDSSAIAQFVPLILIFGIMYFLLIRPQQKKVKEHQKMVAALRFVELSSSARATVAFAAQLRAQQSTLVTTFSNKGYVPFLRNLACSLERLRLRNWLVIAWDNETCPGGMLRLRRRIR